MGVEAGPEFKTDLISHITTHLPVEGHNSDLLLLFIIGQVDIFMPQLLSGDPEQAGMAVGAIIDNSKLETHKQHQLKRTLSNFIVERHAQEWTLDDLVMFVYAVTPDPADIDPFMP